MESPDVGRLGSPDLARQEVPAQEAGQEVPAQEAGQEVPAQEARQESPGPGSQAGRPGPGSRAGREGPLRGASPGLDVGRQEVLTLSGRKSWPRKPGRKGRPYEGGFTRTGQ